MHRLDQGRKRFPGIKARILLFLLPLALTGIIAVAAANFTGDAGAVAAASCQYGSVGACWLPSLTLSETDAHWASWADYQNGDLTVDYVIHNTLPGFCTSVVGTVDTNGVTAVSSFPLQVGDIYTSGDVPVSIIYHVPAGVSSFKSTVYVTSANACGHITFPGPYPGS